MPEPHYIDVDLKQTTYLNEPQVTQNDDVTFIVRVLDDGHEFLELNTYSTFTMASVRPDKQPVLTNSTSVIGNEITFILGSTEIAVPGRVEAAIQLYDVNGRISSIPFSFMVIKDRSVGYIPSANEQTLIELVLGQGPAILDEAQRVSTETTEAEALRVTAESNRVTAENQRVTAETDRGTAESSRVTTESARVNAETVRKTAEDGRVQAESERQTNTSTAIQNAGSATTDAISATEAINLVLPNVLNLEYIAPYNATTQYLKNNIVRKDKNSYIALQDTLGNEPTGTTDSLFWGVIAIGGVDGTGTGTVTSVNGISPVDGNVTLEIPNSWTTLNDKPLDFPPSAHTHEIANVTGLQTHIDAATTHWADLSKYANFTKNANQSIADAISTQVTWNLKTSQNGEDFCEIDVATGRIKILQSGLYEIAVMVRLDPNATGIRILTVGGQSIALTSAAGVPIYVPISDFIQYNSGDLVNCSFYQTSGGALNILSSTTIARVRRISKL